MVTPQTGLRWLNGLVLFVFMSPALHAAEEPADALARGLLERADARAGVCEMPRVGDDWSHHLHAADGNLVSLDRAFSGVPCELQWTGKPYYGGHWDIRS